MIGLSDYPGSSLDLTNGVKDAQAVAEVLGRLGFEVALVTNAGVSEMRRALEDLSVRSVNADVSLLFYSGHGMEVDGENLLISTDEGHPEETSLYLSEVLNAVRSAKVRLAILDACRTRSTEGLEFSAGQVTAGGNEAPIHLVADAPGEIKKRGFGWVAVTTAPDTLLAYGTAPGAVAFDSARDNRDNAPFTAAILESIQVPGIEMSEIMRRITRSVREATSDGQHPWLSASYTTPFFFIPPRNGLDFTPSSAPAPDVQGWFALGEEHYRDEKYSEALEPLRRSALAGHPGAQFYLGRMYMSGMGVRKSPREAFRWFTIASSRGHAMAQLALGGFYSGGFVARRDDERAIALYRRAAEQGWAAAMFRLGASYEGGRGVEKDIGQAVRWYWQAAARGYTKADDALRELDDRGYVEAARALQKIGRSR